MTATEETVTRTVRIWLGDDGIIRMVDLPGTEEALEDAVENVKTVWNVSEGKKRPVLIDIRGLKSITREARQYYASGETARFGRAIGLVIGSPMTRVIGNFFFQLNRPALPLKLFTSEEKALEWLKGFTGNE
jgi:hypothetical protein